MDRRLSPLLEGGRYYEGPRWHSGRLWFTDTLAGAVLRISETGTVEELCKVEGVPCGLGFLPSGELIILSMFRKRLYRWSGGTLSLYADLSQIAKGTIDDMIIDREGRAFVGDLGADLLSGPISGAIGRVILVTPEGRSSVVAEGLSFPNGIAIDDAGSRLVVAESDGDSLAEFDVSSSGALRFAKRYACAREPDGICLDRDGGVWISAFKEDAFVRVDRAGRETDRISTKGRAIACAIGGSDRRTLFCLSAETSHEELMKGKSKARMDTVRLEIPGGGAP